MRLASDQSGVGPAAPRAGTGRRAARRAGWAALVTAAVAAGAARPVSAAGTESATADSIVVAKAAPTSQPAGDEPANLMTGLDQIGIGKPVRDLGINVYGWVEGGYTYQFLQPNDTINARAFDYQSNRVLLNQAAINVERAISDPYAPIRFTQFDVGFRVEALEGTDAQYTQSLQSYSAAKGASNYVFDVGGTNSRYQFDLPDLYVDFGVPIGNGVRVRAGRFEFFKPLNPNQRLFYSTSFVYTAALPRTNTGVTVAYDFNDKFGLEAGFSRGYNVTVNDFNGAVDFLGAGHLNLSEDTKALATLGVGPELARDSRDYTVLVDAAITHTFTSDVSVGVDGTYAHQFGNSDASLGYSPFNAAGVHIPASYYGVSGVAAWQINDYVQVGGRIEWLRDDGGILSGANRSLYEATVGTTVTPFPHDPVGQNLKVRPEVRYDYSNRAFFGVNPFSAPTRKDQLTFGVDVIYNF